MGLVPGTRQVTDGNVRQPATRKPDSARQVWSKLTGQRSHMCVHDQAMRKGLLRSPGAALGGLMYALKGCHRPRRTVASPILACVVSKSKLQPERHAGGILSSGRQHALSETPTTDERH